MGRGRQNRKKIRISKNLNRVNSPFPEYLSQKPELPESIPPPVQTRQQELPFEKLSWENFERLCKALVETDHEIRSCYLYGRQGHKQNGIDLIAYPKDFKDGRPRVFQCKRVETFGPAKIRGAVKKFLENKRKPLPTHFVLCCKSSLRSTQCQDEIRKQTERLQEHDIVFEVWDGDELSRKLKDHPKIVDEYFGREWVRAFNGPEAVAALERKIEPFATTLTVQPDQVNSLLLSKDLEIQGLKSALDIELSQACDQIKERYKKGRRSESLNELQTYIDRFQTDLHAASPHIRARFWYTAGALNWKFAGGREYAQQCLGNARRIDPTHDLRPLEARVLLSSEQYDEALRVLQPIDTLPVFTLSLAILLDLGRTIEFDAVWSSSTIEPDDVSYQLLAYRHRLERRFDEAQVAIQRAIDQVPIIPTHYVAAGHITFWKAVPEHLDEFPRTIPPATFHPVFYRPTDGQAGLLDKAVDFYGEAISLLQGVRTEEADQIREIKTYQLLCMAYHPQRQSEAKEHALRLLDDDPGNFVALFYCIEWDLSFNSDRSIHIFEAKRLGGSAVVNDFYMLIKLYNLQGQDELAIRLLEVERERFIDDKARYLWIELMAELLLKGGDAVRATTLIENYQPDDPFCKRRLEAQFYDRIGDHQRLEEAGVKLYERSGAMIDLQNLCGFYRKTEQWGKLEPYALQLVDRLPDPGSVSLLAQALYHNRKFEECLALFERHTGLFLDARLPDDLRHIEIECLFKLNRLDRAILHLEALRQEHPSSNVVQNLAHAYFRMGKREKAVVLLRESSELPWADTTLRLASSQLLLRESPEEAFRLAQRVREESPDDPRAWLHYIQTGFLAGHDREASETLQVFLQRFPDTPLMQRMSLDDLIERAREWRESQIVRWDLYRSAKVPVHAFLDAERQSLGFHWFIRFYSNKSSVRWDQKYPVFIRYGGRHFREEYLSQLNPQGLIIDYTALLLAYEMNLLPLVERVFPRILLPPSLLIQIQIEAQKIGEHQPSRLQIRQKIKNHIDERGIGVITDLVEDAVLRDFQMEDLGAEGARLFYLANKYQGLVLAKHLLREEEKRYAIVEPLARLRVFPREVLTAMYQMGLLAQHELEETTQYCHDEPCRENAVQAIAQCPLLVTDELTMGFFVDIGLHNKLTQTFRISMPAMEVESINRGLQEDRLRQSAIDWLDGLRHYISERLNRNYYFPSSPIDINEEDQGHPCTLLLQETIHITQKEQFPVWIDDRFAHQHERIEQSQILGTDAILVFLRSKGLLSDEEYYRHLHRLMELNGLFLPMVPEMVLHFLRGVGIEQRGHIRESYELKTIRRYFAGVFAEGSSLGILSPGSGKLPESILYYHQYQSACRNLLQKVWLSGDLSDDQKKAFSNWIVGRLWRGLDDIFHLLPDPPALQEAVALSQYLLICIAFEILFQEISTVERSSGYLCWLYDRFLDTHWEANPEVKCLVMNHMVSLFKSMTEGREDRHQKMFLALSASLLVKAPHEIIESLFKNDLIQMQFKDYIGKTVEILEGLKISLEEWRQWAFECITLGTGTTVEKNVEGRSLSLQWNESSPFLHSLRIQIVSQDGTQDIYTRIEPFIKFYHPSPEIREQALDALLPFLRVSSTNAVKLKECLVAQTGWELTAAEIEALANSSWRYFWERLTQLIQARIPAGVDLIFPGDPSIFATHFPLSSAAMEDPLLFRTEWSALVQERLRTEDFETILAELLTFPFGEGISSSEMIARLIDSGNIQCSQALEAVLKFADKTANPVALQNCLDILLTIQEGDSALKDNIRDIVHRLLSPEDTADPDSLASIYGLYITALQFAWNRMRTIESFQSYLLQERIMWAYAYAGDLMEGLDSLRKDQNILLNYSTFSKWLLEKVKTASKSILDGSFNEQIEVTHPVKASRFRTIVSGTLCILIKHKNKLCWLNVGLMEKAVLIARQVVQGTISGGEEIFKPFSRTRNFFGAPFNQNVFSSLKEIFEFIGDESLRLLQEQDRHLVQSIQGFDLKATLSTTLYRIIDCKYWKCEDLLPIYLTLSEPLDPSLFEILQQAIIHMDLSCWPEDRDFAFACMTLAQCAIALNNAEAKNKVMEKSTDAWAELADQKDRYVSILNAVVIVVSNGSEENKASELYKWWRGAIEKSKNQIPEEVYEIAVSLTWGMPIIQQQGLSAIKSRLAILF